jgi:hypothetical protein
LPGALDFLIGFQYDLIVSSPALIQPNNSIGCIHQIHQGEEEKPDERINHNLSRSSRSRDGLLRSRSWDLTWITLSVVLVTLPYLIYLSILGLQSALQPAADFFGADIDSLARNIVNAVVALVVGGAYVCNLHPYRA